MASPNNTQPPTSTTPPTATAEPPTATQQPQQPQPQTQPTTSTSTSPPSIPNAQPPRIPATSLKDNGKSRRPRDVRLIHLLLASLGVSAYEERVPLQLLDFAYRYTSSILQDAIHLSTEGYAGAIGMDSTSSTTANTNANANANANTTNANAGASAGGVNASAPGSGSGGGGGGGGGGAPTTNPSGTKPSNDPNTVSLAALRLSIASRLHYQFQTGLPKEFLMDVAAERNRIALPGASRGVDSGRGGGGSGGGQQSVVMAGMRLPPERFCLTGVGWDLKDEWESEGEEEVEVDLGGQGVNGVGENGEKAEGGEEEGEGMGEGDEDGKMEDVFGEDAGTGMDVGDGDGDGDGDREMADA